MRTKKERIKKEEAKDDIYLNTYTRHLEKRIRNLKTVNLKLKEELKNLQNEKE